MDRESVRVVVRTTLILLAHLAERRKVQTDDLTASSL